MFFPGCKILFPLIKFLGTFVWFCLQHILSLTKTPMWKTSLKMMSQTSGRWARLHQKLLLAVSQFTKVFRKFYSDVISVLKKRRNSNTVMTILITVRYNLIIYGQLHGHIPTLEWGSTGKSQKKFQ